jgi:hypothetical protein
VLAPQHCWQDGSGEQDHCIAIEPDHRGDPLLILMALKSATEPHPGIVDQDIDLHTFKALQKRTELILAC